MMNETRRCAVVPYLVYLNLAILLPTDVFQQGLLRFALLSAFLFYFVHFLGAARAIALPDWGLQKMRCWAQLMLFEVIPASVLVVSLTSPNKVRIWEAFVVVVLVAALIGRDRYTLRPAAQRKSGAWWFDWALAGLALSVPLLNLASGLLVPKLSDVATTTIDAVHILLQGHNPYAAALDPYGAINAHDPAFGGYKYLPLMIAVYLPFVVLFGAMGVLWANVLLVGALCVVIWGWISRNTTGPSGASDVRPLAIALLLATPELAETTLAMGYNDVVGSLLVLAAFLVRGRSALLAGLLVGCSLSMKLMPGLVAAAVVFPPDRWKAYGTGMAVGMLPTVLFLAWDPAAFIRNILLFNLVRSPDPTSWRMFAPAALGSVAALGALTFWLGASAWLALHSWRGKVVAVFGWGEPYTRLILFIVATLLLIMSGSTAHDDYMIWWMPAVILIFCGRGRAATA